ncbi:hypothetical protein [Streptomyces sp. NPDC050759]|uniref:hypothetical protein n=1 Tax=Streptomyces sp. NPDC050759 TaxID=3365635 RepID=UPI0037B5E1F0
MRGGRTAILGTGSRRPLVDATAPAGPTVPGRPTSLVGARVEVVATGDVEDVGDRDLGPRLAVAALAAAAGSRA